MGWVNAGALIGPAIGPVLGGILAQFLGWRAIFWFLVILAGVFMIPLVLAFQETCRKVVGDGSVPPQPWNRDLLTILRGYRNRDNTLDLQRTASKQSAQSARAAMAVGRKLRVPNPLHTLKMCRERDVAMLLLYNCLVYTAFYDIITSM